MKFENTFDVKAPIDEVYATMLDVERVAPCVPGAQVLEQSGEDSYKVSIKVKLGPIQMTYRGDVEIVERDEANHRAVMRARAREARGQGTADATVEMTLTADGEGTHGEIASDVALSGKAASMGRGIIQDVSGKLIDQFSANLATMLEGGPAEPEAAPTAEMPAAAGSGATAETAPAEATVTDASGAAGAGAGAAPTTPPPPRQPTPEPEPLDAGNIAGAVVADRLRDPKTIAGLGVVLLIVLWLLRRRR
jgi:carbon monoxide dehydrogenase subunit G